MTNYVVHVGDNYPTPRISGWVGNYLEFRFSLSDNWAQLYNLTDNSTHKIMGVSDLFGSNSMRLGVRRAPLNQNGITAVNYTHVKGKVGYPAIKDHNEKALILHYCAVYTCRIFEAGNQWEIQVWLDGKLLGRLATTMSIPKNVLGRRLSGIYVEVGSQPSPFELNTSIEIVQK